MASAPESRGVTPTAFALGWVWNNRLVHGVIAGPKTLAQWQDYVDAIGQPFDADDETFVSALVSAGHASTPNYTDPQYPIMGARSEDRLTIPGSSRDRSATTPNPHRRSGSAILYRCHGFLHPTARA
jgi:hypothetical protein